MKHIKLFEDMKTVKFSDMENWSVDNINKKAYSGNKEFNYELGNKVISLLDEYGLGIIGVGPGKWLEKSKLLLPDEINFKEYRVNIGKRQDWNDFIDEYENDHNIVYDELDENEQEKINEIYNNLPYEELGNDYIEFSVFLSSNVTNIEAAAMSDASTYLKLLVDSGFDLYDSFNDYNVFFDNPISTKKFINGKKIVINNSNLEELVTVSNRLYKDGKVFYLFKEYLGESTAKRFFNDWLKLI